MSLIQTLVVRNDASLAVDNIKFHLDAGVDHIVLTDHRSTDGLRDHLEKFIRQGVVTYKHQDSEMFDQAAWVTGMVNFAHEHLGAKWIINSDADEFWIAKDSSSLKDVFYSNNSANILVADRHDFVFHENSSAKFWEKMIYRKAISTNCFGNPLPPKVAHRSQRGLSVAAGNHSVDGFSSKNIEKSKLEVLHFPIRGRDDYKEKIRIGALALSKTKHVKAGIGQTWRMQAKELEETGQIKFLNDNVYTDIDIQRGLTDGSLLSDTRLFNRMRAINAGMHKTTNSACFVRRLLGLIAPKVDIANQP